MTPLSFQAWQLPDEMWKKDRAKVSINELSQIGREVTSDWLLFTDPKTQAVDPNARAPFVYITREGTPGILYVEIPVVDDSPKLGGVSRGDDELNPIAFRKGRRFGMKGLVPTLGNDQKER